MSIVELAYYPKFQMPVRPAGTDHKGRVSPAKMLKLLKPYQPRHVLDELVPADVDKWTLS